MEAGAHARPPAEAHASPMEAAAPDLSRSSIDLQGLTPIEASIRAAISSILTEPAPPYTLARFVPPQTGLPESNIVLFPPIFSSSDPTNNICKLEHLLISIVLLNTTKGEWKRIQSANGMADLQRVLVAEAAGEVPPYTPTLGRTIEWAPGDTRRRNRTVWRNSHRTTRYSS